MKNECWINDLGLVVPIKCLKQSVSYTWRRGGEHTSYNSDGSLYGKDIYKYDKKGNIVKQVSYKSDGKPETIYEWIIEYYP